MVKIYNSTKNNLIAGDVKIAKNFFTRSIGLLSRKNLSEDEALIIRPCSSIHTFFMKFKIDVIFVDKNNKIIALYENVEKNKILPIHLTSKYVIELAAGRVHDKNIKKNDVLLVEQQY